jgi:hypothetical protein
MYVLSLPPLLHPINRPRQIGTYEGRDPLVTLILKKQRWTCFHLAVSYHHPKIRVERRHPLSPHAPNIYPRNRAVVPHFHYPVLYLTSTTLREEKYLSLLILVSHKCESPDLTQLMMSISFQKN